MEARRRENWTARAALALAILSLIVAALKALPTPAGAGGRVIAVAVAAGESVAKGQKLVTLEAMKMEHTTAPFDGIVAELDASEGAQVSEGALLARVERAD